MRALGKRPGRVIQLLKLFFFFYLCCLYSASTQTSCHARLIKQALAKQQTLSPDFFTSGTVEKSFHNL